jgi:hypothetical protein
MAPRLQLQTLLENLNGGDTDPDKKLRVYFQPPPNVKMTYPCIIYKRDTADTKFADNEPYTHTKRYQVIVVDSNPDSDIPDKVAMLPLCIFSRFYTADNLNHDVFNLFF